MNYVYLISPCSIFEWIIEWMNNMEWSADSMITIKSYWINQWMICYNILMIEWENESKWMNEILMIVYAHTKHALNQ